MSDTTVLLMTEDILNVDPATMPPDTLTPPTLPLPAPFTSATADPSATTLPPEMLWAYNSILAQAQNQHF